MKHTANWIAAGTFVLGCTGFYLYTKKFEEAVRGGQAQAVLLVTQDLKPGDTLAESALGITEVPSDYLDSRRVRASEKENLVGVRVAQNLKAGDAILWSDIDDGAAHKHLAALVAPGRRAYSLKSDANPLGRLLKVADHVDVLLEKNGTTDTILQNVLVLAVGGQLERTDSLVGGKTIDGTGVTLSVSTEDAGVLLAAEGQGKLRLVLRNPEDEKTKPKKDDAQHLAAARTVAAGSETSQEIEHVR
jgi:pilus assembly protein CpaB